MNKQQNTGMRKALLALLALAFPLALGAQTHVLFTLSEFNASPTTNRTVTVQALTPFKGNLISYSSSTNGYFYVSNMAAGDYDCVILKRGTASEIAFQITVTSANLGVINAASNTSVRGVQSYPVSGKSAWTILASEARYGAASISDGTLTTNKIDTTFYNWIDGQGLDLTSSTNLPYTGLSTAARSQIETNAAYQAYLATNNFSAGTAGALTNNDTRSVSFVASQFTVGPGTGSNVVLLNGDQGYVGSGQAGFVFQDTTSSITVPGGVDFSGTNIQSGTLRTNEIDSTFRAWVLDQSSAGISSVTATNIVDAKFATVAPITNADTRAVSFYGSPFSVGNGTGSNVINLNGDNGFIGAQNTGLVFNDPNSTITVPAGVSLLGDGTSLSGLATDAEFSKALTNNETRVVRFTSLVAAPTNYTDRVEATNSSTLTLYGGGVEAALESGAFKVRSPYYYEGIATGLTQIPGSGITAGSISNAAIADATITSNKLAFSINGYPWAGQNAGLITDGDSLNLAATGLYHYLTNNHSGWRDFTSVSNYAVSGNSMATILSRFDTDVAAAIGAMKSAGITNIYLLFDAGANGLSTSFETTYSDWSNYIARAQSSNVTVITVSVLPQTPLTSSTTITNWFNLNRAMRMSGLPNYFADWARVLTDPVNTTWFADGTHPTAAGYTRGAEYVDAVVRGLKDAPVSAEQSELATTNRIVFSRLGNPTIAVSDAGNVGIQQLNPTAALQIGDRWKLTSGGAGYWGSAGVHGVLSWDSTNAIIGAYTGMALELRANNTGKAYLSASGKFGIGTDIPASLLHVAGTALATNFALGSASINSWDDVTNYFTMPGGATGGVYLWTNNVDADEFQLVNVSTVQGIATGATDGSLILSSDPTSDSSISMYGPTLGFGMRYSASSHTFIGPVNMTNISGGLDVAGTLNATNATFHGTNEFDTVNASEIVSSSLANTYAYWGSDGVLTGSNAPSGGTTISNLTESGYTSTFGSNVVVNGNLELTNGKSLQMKDSGGSLRNILIMTAGDDNVTLAGRSGVSDVYLNSATTFTLKSTGNVGIGTATPVSKFHVKDGVVTVSTTNLATSITAGINMTNATAAANGAQQNSPALMLGGAGYNTTGSTSAPVSMGFVTVPVQGTTPSAYFQLLKSIGGAAPSTTGSYFDSSGGFATGGQFISGATIYVGAGSPLSWNVANASAIYGSANGPVSFNSVGANSTLLLSSGSIGSTAASLLTSTNWPALRVENSTNRVRLGVREGTNTTNFGEITARFIRPIKAGFSTNYTINPKTESTIFWSGTNQVLTLPDPTLAPGEEITLVGATTTGSATATNHNGSVTLKGTLSVSIGATNTVVFRSDGSNWW